MNERENILTRVREALRLRAPMPGGHSPGQLHPISVPRRASEHARTWLPKVGASTEEQFELFRAHSADLKSGFHLLNSVEDLPQILGQLKAKGGWKRIATHGGELTSKAVNALGLPVLTTDSGYDVHEMESCDAGITECDGLIAQTGSVLITSRSAGGRALSVLPPHHVVLARRNQLVSDLPAAFELLTKKYGGQYPSFISFVTGPSRTGDIERILVLGAHGPKELTILCW